MLHPTPTLYQPTTAEIQKVAASAKHRHPECSSRLDKAAEIVASGLQLEPVAWDVRNVVHWHIASQSHAGAYIVVNTHCPCQDTRAPHVCNGRFCKHATAVSLYMKILANRFNDDVRARQIDLGICTDGTFNAYARRLGFCHVRKMGSAYVFADQASAVRFSLWLAAQQPIPVDMPVAFAVAA